MFKKLLYGLIGLTMLLPLIATAAPTTQYFTSIAPFTNDTYYNGTTTLEWLGLWTKYASTTVLSATSICLTGDLPCRATWPTGSTGLGTTSPWTIGQVAYVASDSAVTSVATGTISASAPLSVTANRYAIGGNAAFTITQSGVATNGYLSSTDWNIFNNKVSSSSLAQIFPFTPTTFGLTAANSTSTLIGFTQGIYSLASSTIGNGTLTGGLTIAGWATTTNLVVTNNATTTFATSTSSFATTASSTNLFSTFATSTFLFARTASTTNLYTAAGLCSGSNALQTDVVGKISCGAISGFSTFGYPFTDIATWNTTPHANSTSTLMVFTAGIGSTASSTIGGGTVSTGLTIAGWATTTNLIVTGLSTTTSATSTNFFATTASSTNEFTSNLIFTNATGTSATTTSFFATTASSTNLFATFATTTFFKATTASTTNLYTSVGTCTGNNALQTSVTGLVTCGAVSAATFAWPFTVLAPLLVSTSSQILFTIGILASSTSYFGNIDIDQYSTLRQAGITLGYASSTNNATIFGLQAGGQNATTSATVGSTTAIGFQALNAVSTALGNTAVGSQALKMTTAGNNVAVGASAGVNYTNACCNVLIGANAGHSTTNVPLNGNVIIGNDAGTNLTSGGSGNILIGGSVSAPSASGSSQLNIGNLIYGTGIYFINDTPSSAPSNGSVGINITTPLYTFDVAGSGRFTTGLLSVSTTTIGNGTIANGLTVNGWATTTNLLVTGNGTTTNATSSALFSTIASTSNLFLNTSTCNTSSALQVTSSGLVTCGAISGFATFGYPFTDSSAWNVTPHANATTTLLVSTIGIGATGSSTIGGGTQTTGLTIGGGSTTTLFAYFASKVGIGSTTPYVALSLDRTATLASSSILVSEYKYGAAGNIGTSTSQTIDCRTSNSLAWPIGGSATTITLAYMTPGATCSVTVQNPNQTAGALTWAVSAGNILKWTGGTVPTQTTTANTYDVWSFKASQGSSTVEVMGAATLNI